MTRRSFLSAIIVGGNAVLYEPEWSMGFPNHELMEVSLRIAPARVDVGRGRMVTTTAYNGGVPGPLIRLREGIQVGVEILNETDTPEYVHWHGFAVAADIDGAQEENSLVVPARGSLRYRMTPEDPGSRWVHSHVMAMEDLTRGTYGGQFGFVYVEPRSNAGRYDQEVFLATHEWEPFFIESEGDGTVGSREEFGEKDWGQSMVEVGYRMGSINGKALGHGEPIRVREGQRVLLHILNASATENIELSLPGHEFLVTALDGNPVPRPGRIDVLELGAAERIDAVVEMNNPGVWILGSTDNDVRGSGLGILVEYAGKKGLATPGKTIGMSWDYTLFGAEHETPPPDETIPIVIARVPPDTSGLEGWMINGKSYEPRDTPMVLRKGTRYRLVFRNESGDAHPLHLHRNTFELTNVNGKTTAGLRKDVVVVKAHQTVEVDVVPTQKGLTLFHCHNQFHMDHGFRKLFNVL